jgi:hypothetical protein
VVSSIERELLRATGEELVGGDQDQIGGLVGKANDLPEQEWNQLSQGARDWVNKNVQAINAEEPVKGFPAD